MLRQRLRGGNDPVVIQAVPDVQMGNDGPGCLGRPRLGPPEWLDDAVRQEDVMASPAAGKQRQAADQLQDLHAIG